MANKVKNRKDILQKIEILRSNLNDAAKKNASKEDLLKISRGIDYYIVEYYQKSVDKK